MAGVLLTLVALPHLSRPTPGHAVDLLVVTEQLTVFVVGSPP